MAEPVRFSESNFVWRGWKGSDGEPDVGDLHAWSDGREQISCWRLSWRERLAVLFSGRVWLRVIGRQPPVCVEGSNPFSRAPVLAEQEKAHDPA